MKRWSAEQWFSFAAIVIATCALGLSIYEGISQRRHERLQLKPHAFLATIYDEEGVKIYLGNAGLGPGIVEWFEVRVDDESQPNWASVAEALSISRYPYGFLAPSRGVVVRPNQESLILHIDPGIESEIVKRSFERLDLAACYCSLYDECWITRGDSDFPEAVNNCGRPPDVAFSADPILREIP